MACLEEPMRESTSSQGRQSCSRNFHCSHRRNMASGLQETAKEKCEQTGRATTAPRLPSLHPLPGPPHLTHSTHTPLPPPTAWPPCTGKIPDAGLCAASRVICRITCWEHTGYVFQSGMLSPRRETHRQAFPGTADCPHRDSEKK